MTYKRTLQLFFTPASFMRNRAAALPTGNTTDTPIRLTFVGDSQEHNPQPLSTEKRFFLQIMRAHLQCLPQATTKLKDLLKFISCNWDNACRIGEETRILGISYMTEPTILSDEVLAVKVVLLLRAMKTKVHVRFEVKVQTHEKAIELDVNVQPMTKVVYGEELKERKMAEFLEQKISVMEKPGINDGGSWARAVLELQERLIARGKK
jgi:kinetochore protein Spc7/SPC105